MMGCWWNISTDVGLKGHPSFWGDRKTNGLTLSCDWLSYIYLIIMELLGTSSPSTRVTLAAFPLFGGTWDQAHGY